MTTNSIYAWRFAELSNILDFHAREPTVPHSATYTLGTNYRCSQEIVAASSRVIANNKFRETKDIHPRAGAGAGS